MPDIANLETLVEDLTEDEKHFLARAEFLKFRSLILELTPKSLAGMQAAIGAAKTYELAPDHLREMCRGVALTAFDPTRIQEFRTIHDAIQKDTSGLLKTV